MLCLPAAHGHDDLHADALAEERPQSRRLGLELGRIELGSQAQFFDRNPMLRALGNGTSVRRYALPLLLEVQGFATSQSGWSVQGGDWRVALGVREDRDHVRGADDLGDSVA